MDRAFLDIQTKIIGATFLTNMAVLKKHLPELYEFYKEYKPGNTKITFDDENNLNLVSNGSLVYDGDPKPLSIEQVDAYAKSPKHFVYKMAFPDENIVFKHERILKHLCDKQKNETNNHIDQPWNEEQLDFFCMVGSGLGHHIVEIFQRKKIRIFFLYEPDPDVFFATLQSIELKPLIESCLALDGAFTVRVGGEEGGFVNEVSAAFKEHGTFNVSRIFLYRHYFSNKNDDAFKLFHEIAYRFSTGWGFMEDEIISFTHTISNISSGFAVLKDPEDVSLPVLDKPAFILSNGPSLDDAIPFIRKHRDEVIIFSCGTTLRALLKNSIVPDFHVEMERSASVMKFIDLIEEKEEFKNINIIALNTVYTDIMKMFKNAYLMLKPNDAGANLVSYLDKEEKFPKIGFCNPTVSNTALSAAMGVGFKNIYLFGVDLGYKDITKHHSKDSIYQDKKWERKEEIDKRYKNGIKVPGNFEEEVYTTQFFDSSKGIMEMALANRPDINVYNCSDGAKIMLAKPMRFQDISFKEKIDRKNELLSLIDNCFEHTQLTQDELFNIVELKLKSIQNCMVELLDMFEEKRYSREELVDVLSKQYKKLNSWSKSREKIVEFTTFRGSFIYFQTALLTNSYGYTDLDKRAEFISYGIDMMKEHFYDLIEELKTGYKEAAKV